VAESARRAAQARVEAVARAEAEKAALKKAAEKAALQERIEWVAAIRCRCPSPAA